MQKIKIVTLCTAEYNQYMDNFLLTYSNVFPNIEKELYIISDRHRQIDIPGIYQIEIQDEYYKLIQLNKLKYIMNALSTRCNPYTDDSKFLYIDIDTIFINKPMEQWDLLWNDFLKYDLIFTHHPIWWQYNKDNVTQEYMIDFYSDKDERCSAIIQNKLVWVIMSAFGGTVSKLAQVYDKYNEMEYIDIEHNFIPSYPDEQYVNKIINDFANDMGIVYNVDIYNIIKTINGDSLAANPKIFLYQKYASTLKIKNQVNNIRLGNTPVNDNMEIQVKQETVKDIDNE